MFSVLRVLVGLLMLQALVKVAVFFVVKYETRRKMLDSQYGSKNTATKNSDRVLLTVVIALLGLLFNSGHVDYVTFGVGLWVGMTLIQTYFHEFSRPLRSEQLPNGGDMSPIKLMSYAIQADPALPWKQLAIITLLVVWVLYRTLVG